MALIEGFAPSFTGDPYSGALTSPTAMSCELTVDQSCELCVELSEHKLLYVSKLKEPLCIYLYLRERLHVSLHGHYSPTVSAISLATLTVVRLTS